MAGLGSTLADVCRSAGVVVQEHPGWQTYARPGWFDPIGIIVHHTAGRGDLNVIINGRPDLPGPLANLYSDRDAPYRITVVSAGRCNHAGEGSERVLNEVRAGIAPSGDAAARGLADGPGGNGWFYGIEAENFGDGVQSWPAEQVDAIARCCAAICARMGWTANRVIGHREWTRRKPDPRGFTMPSLRASVARLMEDEMALTPEDRDLLQRTHDKARDAVNYGVAILDALNQLPETETVDVDAEAVARRVDELLARRLAD